MSFLYRKLTFIILFALSFIWNGCENKEEKEREIRRILSKEILTRFNEPTENITLEPENENYIATVKLQNGGNMQVVFMGSPQQFQIMETLNSEVARKISGVLKVNCISMSLEQIDSLTAKGSGELETGEKLNIFYNKNFGWYPTDETSLSVVAKCQISNEMGVKCTKVDLQSIGNEEYNGTALMASGDTILAMVHQKKGWYPVDELSNLLKATKMQVELRTKQKVAEIRGEMIEKGSYQATIASENGEETKLSIKHDGTSFTWGLLEN